MTVEMGKHQLKALEELDSGKILCGGVGSGKSRVALAYYYLKECKGSLEINGKGAVKKMEQPVGLYVITTAKKRDTMDWLTEAVKLGISTDMKDNQNGVKLNIDSWNNIGKYEDRKGCFFIFDEQRLVGSGAWVKSFLKIAKNNRWILLSATPGDVWLDYIPVFLANGWYRNRTDFIRQHVVYKPFNRFPQIDRYTGEGTLNKLRRRVLVEMPMDRGTRRHILYRFVGYDSVQFERLLKHRWHPYLDRPIKDIAELFAVMRKMVNRDPSRIEEIIKISEKHPRLIIFYNFNYELELLRELGEIINIPIGEWNGHKHESIPDTDRWLYLVQYTAGAEGWNCISTDAMVFYSLNYSYRVMEQAMGRIDRMNTLYVDLYYYILRSTSRIDSAILKAIRSKKRFNERKQKWAEEAVKSGHYENSEILTEG